MPEGRGRPRRTDWRARAAVPVAMECPVGWCFERRDASLQSSNGERIACSCLRGPRRGEQTDVDDVIDRDYTYNPHRLALTAASAAPPTGLAGGR
jgi:hypothetical protein